MEKCIILNGNYTYTLENYLEFIHITDPNVCILESEYLIEKLDLQTIKNAYQKYFGIATSALSKYKINIKSLERAGLSLSKEVESAYKKGEDSKAVAKRLTIRLMKYIKDLVLNKVKRLSLTEKIVLSLAAFALILLLNSLVGSLLVKRYGARVGVAILAPIMGPLTEEAAKNYFIARGMPWVGTSIVFGLEAIMYLYRLYINGKSLGLSIIQRSFGVSFHFATMIIQKKIIEKGKTKEEQEQRRFKAFLVGFALHMAYNSIASIALLTGVVSVSDVGL